MRIRDERWRVERATRVGDIDLLTVHGCGATNRSQTGAFLLPFETVDRLDADASPRAASLGRWRRETRRILARAQPSWSALRAATHARCTIVPYQLEPVLAFAGGRGSRILLADGVGLGKTIQAGLLAAELHLRRPEARTLVVAPASLRDQWKAELTDRFSLTPTIVDSPELARCRSHLQAESNPWSLTPIVITSIDFVKRPEVMRALEPIVWDLVIFDEAHHLAGRSDRFAAARALGSRARTVVLITATPHSGDEGAFDRLCGIGVLHANESLLVFERSRTEVGMPHRRRDTCLYIQATAAERSIHEALSAYARRVWARTLSSRPTRDAGARLAMAVLMRRACSSARSLERTLTRRLALLSAPESDRDCQLGLPFSAETLDDHEPTAGLETPGLADPGEERAILQQLRVLAHEAARHESKPGALRRLIEKAGEPAIVFTEYRDTLQVLAAALPGVTCAELHGGLTRRQRQEALSRFTSGDAQVLLATDAAGEGLNLHRRCRLVVSLEVPWSPLRLEQRAGRVDRIGQTRVVHAVRFVARDTCEETTLARLEERRARIHAVGTPGRPLTEDQVADRILGDGLEPGSAPSTDGAPDLVPMDLGREAELEARRIAAARALEPGDASTHLESRALIARLRRRAGAFTAGHGVWTFQITLSTRSGEVLWEPLVSLAAELGDLATPTRRRLRVALAPEHPSIVDALDRARLEAVHTLVHSIRPPAEVWTRREQDIIAALRSQHARLSATLGQRLLFGGERDRSAAPQAKLLEAALAQCADRLQALNDLDNVEVESVRLAFAAVVL